jgi:AraC-like DNA-binding protein
LWYLTDGTIEVDCNAHVTLGRGSLVWFPPGCVHSVQVSDRRRSFTCYSFRFAWHSPVPSQPLLIEHAQELLPFIDALYRETCQHLFIDQQRCLSLLYVIATHRLQDSNADRSLNSIQRQALHQYVQRHIHLQLRPADLAQLLELTPDYFSRLFKRSFGKSPSRWLMEQRIAIAAYQLEHTSLPVAGIAENCSYTDQNIFSRQFKQVLGHSPTQHRRMVK